MAFQEASIRAQLRAPSRPPRRSPLGFHYRAIVFNAEWQATGSFDIDAVCDEEALSLQESGPVHGLSSFSMECPCWGGSPMKARAAFEVTAGRGRAANARPTRFYGLDYSAAAALRGRPARFFSGAGVSDTTSSCGAFAVTAFDAPFRCCPRPSDRASSERWAE